MGRSFFFLMRYNKYYLNDLAFKNTLTSSCYSLSGGDEILLTPQVQDRKGRW